MSTWNFAHHTGISVALLASGCCAFVGPCTNFDGPPESSWEDSLGRPGPLNEFGIQVQYVSNLASGIRTFEAQWEITHTPGGGIDSLPQAVLSIIDAADIPGDEEGAHRANRLSDEYLYKSELYVNTIAYDAELIEKTCCTNGKIYPVKDVRGPLVSDFRTRTDFPGVIISLRDTL